MFDSPWDGVPEFWIFNPGPHLGVCLDFGQKNFVFAQKTYQFKRNMSISPRKSLEFWSRGRPWTALLVEYDAQVSLLYDQEHGWAEPIAAYPSWSARLDRMDTLELMCANYPDDGESVGGFWGDSRIYCAVPGQQRVILIRNLEKSDFEWRRVFEFITKMKREHSDIRFHFHGQKSVSRTLGAGVDSYDHPVTIAWDSGKPRLLMPNGQVPTTGTVHNSNKMDHWGRIIGESIPAIRHLADSGTRSQVSRAAFAFNLKSLIWANKNRDKIFDFRGRQEGEVDQESSDDDWRPVNFGYRPRSKNPFDRWLCDTCTIAHRCPYSRAGAVCIVEGTEGHQLSSKFRSRQATDIIDALSTLLGAQAERLGRAMDTEEQRAADSGEYKLSPHVTSLANNVFDRGIQMARLIDPTIATQMSNGGKVQIGIQTGALASATPQQLMAGVARKLEEFGISLQDATEEQVQAIMNGRNPPIHARAIEAHDIDDYDDEDDG